MNKMYRVIIRGLLGFWSLSALPVPGVAQKTEPASSNPQQFKEVNNEWSRLNIFVGRWITTGQTVEDAESKSVVVQASDVYEWAPGGKFVLHRAYGKMGNDNVGGIDIIGYDPAQKKFKAYLFNNDGNLIYYDLIFENEVWFWQSAKARCKGKFSEDGKKLVAHHEKLNAQGKWVPSIEVTLTKVD